MVVNSVGHHRFGVDAKSGSIDFCESDLHAPFLERWAFRNVVEQQLVPLRAIIADSRKHAGSVVPEFSRRPVSIGQIAGVDRHYTEILYPMRRACPYH